MRRLLSGRLLVLPLALVLWGALPAWAREGEIATVLNVSGTVHWSTAPGKPLQTLRPRLGLVAGDIVKTGTDGKAALLFSDGSQLRLNSGTSIVVTQPSQVRGRTSFIKVVAGQVWARLRPGRAMTTRYSNLSVRGTEFVINATDEGTDTLTVVEGEVDFANGLGQVLVAANQRSVARPNQAPTAPVTIDNPNLVLEWTVSLSTSTPPLEQAIVSPDRRAARATLARLGAAAPSLELGAAQFDSGQPEAALATFNSLLQANPRDARTQVLAGRTLLQLSRWDEAAALFGAAVNKSAAPAIVNVAMGDEAGETLVLAQAHSGLGWVAMARQQWAAARRHGEAALAALPSSAEAHLLLGQTALRSGASLTEASAHFAKAAAGVPERLRYQGSLGLAQVAVHQGDLEGARSPALEAQKQEKHSALVQATLALIEFKANSRVPAERYARRAVELNPDMVFAQLALAQSLVAAGKLDEGAQAAARVTALDPTNPDAHFALGVADASRRDYRHAARSLHEAARLAPEDPQITSLLARVLLRMGREKEAREVLTRMQDKAGQNYLYWTALGDMHQEDGKYGEGLKAYRKAVELRPESGYAQSRLARLAMDANQLTEAIDAGQKAVQLAPSVAAYHSILGLAYKYARMTTQAQREFRTALQLDPRDALALVQLAGFFTDSDERLADRSAAGAYIQGFTLDPSVMRDFFRSGKNTELQGVAGDTYGGRLDSYQSAQDRKLQNITAGEWLRNDPQRPNGGSLNFGARNTGTVQLAPGTMLYSHVRAREKRFGVPGSDSAPALDDKRNDRIQEATVGLRDEIAPNTYLWTSITSTRESSTIHNPDGDRSFLTDATFLLAATNHAAKRTRALIGETRLDRPFRLGNTQGGWLTVGYAQPRNQTNITTDFMVRSRDPLVPFLFGNERTNQTVDTGILYVNATQRFNDSLFAAAQVQRVRTRNRSTTEGLVPPFLTYGSGTRDETRSLTLPSGVLALQLSRNTSFRFSGSRRFTKVTDATLTPQEAFVTTESVSMPSVLPDPTLGGTLNVFQADVERYLSPGELVKVFAFHSSGRNVLLDFGQYVNPYDPEADNILNRNYLQYDKIKRSGLGLRYERPLGKELFGIAEYAYAATRAWRFDDFLLAPLPFDGQDAPYEPRSTGRLGVNYVGKRGDKVGLMLNYRGQFRQDDGNVLVERPTFASRVTLDLSLARERNVGTELFLGVQNVFDTRQIVFNGISYNPRRIVIGLTKRY